MVARQFRKPRRFKRKKSILRNRFFWLGILTTLIIGAIFYFLFFLETFQVKQTIITGENKVSKENIKLLTEKKLENRLLFFKTKSIFLINTTEIKSDILDSFPQIAEVIARREIPDTIDINVTERSGLAVWCKKENCFLVDNKGVIFEKAPPEETDLPKIVDEQDRNSFNLGEKIIEEGVLKSILDIKINNNSGINIENFVILNSERLNIKIAEGWEIYFNLKEDISWQLTKLDLVLKEEISPERKGDLEYIDLRFSRVYYKYRGGN
ncbi:MAG: hypothetical protein A2Z78_01885 [Candidatus Nealsonbacteria bacterium RBG_13_36_15]|uniref:Uncharacterized protein n=1 Tax=Candidatus Nealsonbacteria bacterium RBG_13_36_15 TaxID=1801660 RepID=A0A1G2DWE4_9BACT|nr:MAG: hypothetical protein A2Z78_01885 [Candidatus Nealsonbacteria bacterium RBG_13_36_15]